MCEIKLTLLLKCLHLSQRHSFCCSQPHTFLVCVVIFVRDFPAFCFHSIMLFALFCLACLCFCFNIILFLFFLNWIGKLYMFVCVCVSFGYATVFCFHIFACWVNITIHMIVTIRQVYGIANTRKWLHWKILAKQFHKMKPKKK